MTVDFPSTDEVAILRWRVAEATGRRPVHGDHPLPERGPFEAIDGSHPHSRGL
jgi:hypothetical protein